MFWPPLLPMLLFLCRRGRRRRYYCCCCCCCCCCCYCAVTRFCVRSKKTQNEKQSVATGCAPRCIAGREAVAAAQQQQQQQQRRRRRRWRRRGSSSGQLPFVVSGWLLCFVSVAECVCAISVCVHPACPSVPWLRGFGLGIKLGACRPIVWTAGTRMNLERSSVQIVHSSGKFRAVFCQGRSI